MGLIRTVVVGIGGRSAWGIVELNRLEAFELVALVDVLPQRAELMKQEHHLDGVAIYADFEKCLAELEFDAVAVFTSDANHAQVVVPALEAGKYVFVEKPLEITAEKLNAIIDADCKVGENSGGSGGRSGGKTFVGFNLRYAPLYEKVRELIDQGVVGQLLTIQADEFYDGGRTYFRRWNRLREHGGGLWITKACHDFDLLYWLAGAQPVSVYASCSRDYYKPKADAAMHCRDCQLAEDCPDRYDRYVLPDTIGHRLNEVAEKHTGRRADLCLYNSDKDTFDHGSALVTFANHVIATYTVNVVAGFTNRTMRVAGTKAVIDADLEAMRVVVHHRDPSSEQVIELQETEDGHGGGDQRILESFADFVHGKPTSFVAPAQAAVAVRMGLAATLSCDEGRVVDLPCQEVAEVVAQ